MTLGRVYTSITSTADGMFYATYADRIYQINPFNQTETPMDPLPYSGVTALESGGLIQFGFSKSASRLFQLDVLSGQQIGLAVDLGIQDVQALVLFEEFMLGVEAFD